MATRFATACFLGIQIAKKDLYKRQRRKETWYFEFKIDAFDVNHKA